MSIAAASIAALGVTLSLIAEVKYSSLNLFAIRPDMLGDYTNSPLAVVYNLSLLVAGACFFLATLAIFFTFDDLLSRIIAVVGGVVGISIALMGIFPINLLEWHQKVSTLYLVATLFLHCLCVLDYFKPGSTMTRVVFGLSCLSVVTASILVCLLDWQTLDFATCDPIDNQFCWVSSTMWVLTQSNVLWCVCLGLGMREHIIKQKSQLPQFAFS